MVRRFAGCFVFAPGFQRRNHPRRARLRTQTQIQQPAELPEYSDPGQLLRHQRTGAAGIQPGFLLSGKYRAKVDGGSWNTEDTKHYFKSTDFSIPVGISYTFEQGLVIDARYNIPVTDIATDEFKEDFSGGNEELNKMTNRVFSLTVGWKF